MARSYSSCNSPVISDFDEQLFILNFATRLLTAFTDRDILVSNALETLADFSRVHRLAIFTLDEDCQNLVVEGLWVDGPQKMERKKFPLAGSPLQETSCLMATRKHPLVMDGDIPLPALLDSSSPGQCLCLPLGGVSCRLVGVTTFELSDEQDLSFQDLQNLRVLATVLAISLDNARLFTQAVCDGLTGAYVRRYYEIRVNEELSKLKRQPGSVAIVLFDLDNFKSVNDHCGHPTGDKVLQAFTGLLKANLRNQLDVICRYGGEEFIILLPDTELDEAVEIAERIRCLCERLQFSEFPEGVTLTVSAGVAATDQRLLLTADEMLRHADSALYKAKQTGRNQIVAWT